MTKSFDLRVMKNVSAATFFALLLGLCGVASAGATNKPAPAPKAAPAHAAPAKTGGSAGDRTDRQADLAAAMDQLQVVLPAMARLRVELAVAMGRLRVVLPAMDRLRVELVEAMGRLQVELPVTDQPLVGLRVMGRPVAARAAITAILQPAELLPREAIHT